VSSSGRDPPDPMPNSASRSCVPIWALRLRFARIMLLHRFPKVLKDDKRLIFSAASHAQRAVDFLRGLQVVADEVFSARAIG